MYGLGNVYSLEIPWLAYFSFTQGCSLTASWHSLICSVLHSLDLPFSLSRCSHRFLPSHLRIFVTSLAELTKQPTQFIFRRDEL
jgi:hypothetical protein